MGGRLTLSYGVDYYVRGSWDEMIESLIVGDHSSVSVVYLGPYFHASLDYAALGLFLEAVGGNMSNLKILTIGSLERTKSVIPGVSLGKLVEVAPKLDTVRIEREVCLRSNEEVAAFARSLSGHPCLRLVTLQRIGCPVGNDASCAVNIDPVIDALSQLQCLESLDIGLIPGGQVTVSPAAMSPLGANKTLCWLVLRWEDLSDRHVEKLAESLVAGRLKILDLPVSRGLGEASWRAFLALVETHDSLERIDVPVVHESHEECKEQVRWWLSLNWDGIRHRLRNETKSKASWVQLVSRRFSHDLSALLVLLKENPSVCHRF